VNTENAPDPYPRYEALEKQHPESITGHLYGIPDWPVDSAEATLDRPTDMQGS
jgi:hypothetical protein